jgi:hypothetical protein
MNHTSIGEATSFHCSATFSWGRQAAWRYSRNCPSAHPGIVNSPNLLPVMGAAMQTRPIFNGIPPRSVEYMRARKKQILMNKALVPL